MKKDVKILVCTHKKDVQLPSSPLYLPVQVGAALTDIHWDIQRDDDGADNISLKNRFYSELSAHYWAWKNLENIDIIGLAHYRRYLNLNNVDKICKILDKHDIILPNPLILPFSNIHNLQEVLTREDVYIMMACLKKLYPNYIPSANKYLMCSNRNVCCNMFITSKEIFDSYSKWLFDILFETEKYVRLSGYTRMKRIFGYYSEVLLPIYVMHNKLNVRYVSMIDFPKSHPTMLKRFLIKGKNLRNNICFILMWPHQKEYYPPASTVTSMKIDQLPEY